MDEQEKQLWAAYWNNRTVENRNALSERYIPLAIAATIYGTRRDGNLFDDAFQEAQLKILQTIPRVDVGHAGPAGLLWVSAYWAARDARMKHESGDLPDVPVRCDLSLTDLDTMPGGELLRMRFIDGMTFDEIAERLGVKSTSARRMYHQAIETLRREVCE